MKTKLQMKKKNTFITMGFSYSSASSSIQIKINHLNIWIKTRYLQNIFIQSKEQTFTSSSIQLFNSFNFERVRK